MQSPNTMRNPNSTTFTGVPPPYGSPYGTIRSSAAPSPAIAVPPPRASPPFPSSAGYIKVATSDPPQPAPPFAGAASSPPVPELQPSPVVRVSDLVTKVKEQGHALILARRPWQELLHVPAFSRPANISTAITRIGRNSAYFRANYIIALLSVLLVSLLYHPFSFFACLALFAAWFFLYFSKTGPLTIFGKTFDDGSVLMVLCGITIAALLFTSVGWSVVGSLVMGLVIVGVHAAFRSTDDLFLTEQEATGGGLVDQVTFASAPFVRMV